MIGSHGGDNESPVPSMPSMPSKAGLHPQELFGGSQSQSRLTSSWQKRSGEQQVHPDAASAQDGATILVSSLFPVFMFARRRGKWRFYDDLPSGKLT